jgi:hypothetical protein
MMRVDENPCPALSQEEGSALKQSLTDYGFFPGCPIVLSAGPACAGMIIDGFHRKKYCDALGIEPVTIEMACATELEYKAFQIILNLKRRQLDGTQRAVLVGRLREINLEAKQLNQQRTQFGHPERSERLEDLQNGPQDTVVKDFTSGQPVTEADAESDAPAPESTTKTDTVEERASLGGLSKQSQLQFDQVMASGEQELIDGLNERLEQGPPHGLSIDKAFKELKRRRQPVDETTEAPADIPTTIDLADEAVDAVATYRPIDQLLSIIRTAMTLLVDIPNEEMTADTEACTCLHEFVRAALMKMEPPEPAEEPTWEWENVGGPT